MLEIRNQSDLTENHIKRKAAGYQRLSSNWLWLVMAVYKPLLADALDIESCRTNALEFLRISSKSILDEDFDSVSLIALIQFENVRVLLKKAEFQLLHEDYPNAIANAAYAFRELLYCYEQNKHRYYKSLFDLSHDFHHIGFNVQLDTKIDHALNEIGDAIECLNERFRSKYYG